MPTLYLKRENLGKFPFSYSFHIFLSPEMSIGSLSLFWVIFDKNKSLKVSFYYYFRKSLSTLPKCHSLHAKFSSLTTNGISLARFSVRFCHL